MEYKKTAVIFIGIQACGKSTFYNENFVDLVHINLDTLHTRNKENKLLEECIKNEKSFVVDNTNPKREDRVKYIKTARDADYKIIGYYFRSSVSESIERNSERTGKAKVPNVAIISTYAKLEIPSLEEGFDELYYVCTENKKFIVKKWKDDERNDNK